MKSKFKKRRRKSRNSYRSNKNKNRSGTGRSEEDMSNDDKSSDYKNISEEDKLSLSLLDIQLNAIIIGFYVQYLLYEATLEGKQLIFDKYDNDDDDIQPIVPDQKVLEATYISFFLRIIYIYIALTRFDVVYNQWINGEFPYSIEPNIDINIANSLEFASNIFLIKAAEGIYARDISQPIFGLNPNY